MEAQHNHIPPPDNLSKKPTLEIVKDPNDAFISLEALEESRKAFFGKGKGITYERYIKLLKKSYIGLHLEGYDLEKYAQRHNFTDGVTVAKYMTKVSNYLETIEQNSKTNRIIVIGCGDGRLIEVYITMARHLGIEEIAFMDLLDEHVDKTKEKVLKIFNSYGTQTDEEGNVIIKENPYGKKQAVKTSYIRGDFATHNFPSNDRYDAAFAIYFVTAEMINPESPEAFSKYREHIFTKINRLLIPEGGLVEEIPDADFPTGFFHDGNKRTHQILNTKNILPGVNKDLMLINFTSEQKAGFPHMLRYTPINGSDNSEKQKTGFQPAYARSYRFPIKSAYNGWQVVNTINNFQALLIQDTTDLDEAKKAKKALEKAIDDLKSTIINRVEFPDETQGQTQYRTKVTWWRKVLEI